jgi:predicted transport protein
MPLFKFKNKTAVRIRQKEFSNERELHELIDSNLEEIFNLRYIKDEYITDKHGRIETLAIDEANRPVIIEYKKIKELGQLTQANRYITWVRQNPDSFELLVRKNIANFKGEIDFSNPRIICFAQEFSMDDKCLALSLNAELWKYRYYENEIMTIIREEEPEQLIRNKPTGKTKIEKIEKEPKKAKSIDEHLSGASPELKALFSDINERILQISDEIERYTTNAEIIYKTSLNFAYVAVQKKNNVLRVLLRSENGRIRDLLHYTEAIPKTHNYGKITHQIHISPKNAQEEKYLDDIMDIIFQAYTATQ